MNDQLPPFNEPVRLSSAQKSHVPHQHPEKSPPVKSHRIVLFLFLLVLLLIAVIAGYSILAGEGNPAFN